MRYSLDCLHVAGSGIGYLLMIIVVGSGCQKAPQQKFINFTEVTAEAGLGSFMHDNGADGRKYYAEQMGSGVGFIDYDGDGWLDILFAGGGYWHRDPYPWYKPLWMYRNMGDGTFTDVTDQVGLAGINAYTLGIAAADYDNDGDSDILITNLNENILLENQEGIFRQRQNDSGLSTENEWSSSALWIDANRDGLLMYMLADMRIGARKQTNFAPRVVAKNCTVFPLTTRDRPVATMKRKGVGSFWIKPGNQACIIHLERRLGWQNGILIRMAGQILL